MRNIQLFIHKYYDSIKLVMLVCIFALVGLGLLYQMQTNADDSKRRGEAILEITHHMSKQTASINKENNEQTETINRQFQALCYLLVEISGEEALRQLDPPIEEQCRDLAIEMRKDSSISRPVAPTPNPSPSVSRATPATPTQQNSATEQKVTQQSDDTKQEKGLVLGILDGAGGLLNGLVTGLLGGR